MGVAKINGKNGYALLQKIAVILIHFHYNQLSIFPVQSTELRCLLLIVNSAVKTEPIKTLGDH